MSESGQERIYVGRCGICNQRFKADFGDDSSRKSPEYASLEKISTGKTHEMGGIDKRYIFLLTCGHRLDLRIEKEGSNQEQIKAYFPDDTPDSRSKLTRS
jgi:hypothetical protein